MAKWINLGEMNKYLFFPFCGGIIKLLLEFLLDRVKKDFSSHPLINGINESFGISLALIPFLIVKIRTKRLNKNFSVIIPNPTNNNEGTKVALKKTEKERIINEKHFLLILSSFLIFLQKYLTLCINHLYMTNLWFYDIIFFSIFSRLILDIKLYKHQFLSLVSLGISSVIIFYFFIIDLQIFDLFVVLYIELIFCIAHVILKYVIDYKFCSAFEACTYEGILSLFFYFIILLSVSFVEIDKNSKLLKIFKNINSDGKIYIDNFSYFSKVTGIEILAFISIAIIRGLYNLSLILTLKHFTPSHIIIILLSDEIYDSLKRDATGDVGYIVITCILFPIIYFSILVFTEIIELNFWGLSKNTRKNITKRAESSEDLENITRNSSFIEMDDDILVRMSVNENENNNN